MRENFIRRFIEDEKYLQNPPLKTNIFIEFCKKRGIETNKRELEFFEKEGLLYPIIRIDRPVKELELLNQNYYEYYGFDKHYADLLIELVDEGYLFDPSTKPFTKWVEFEGEDLENGSERIVSFYSSFQIYWLIILKKNYSFTLELSYDEIIVSSSLTSISGMNISDHFRIENFNQFEKEKEKASLRGFGELVFNFENKKQELCKIYRNFEKILEFFLSIQSIYAPYGRSSSRTISVHDESWKEKKLKFHPNDELEFLKFSIEEVVDLYTLFAKKTKEKLGVTRDDWIQLWKSIAWSEKDELEGAIRLGIEYLQWTLMFKRFIEDHLGREIFDIDEISQISSGDILKNTVSDIDMGLLRDHRNRMLSDPENNYYHDIYKRLFYLANDFELNYQPRIMVFVEGETEEEIFPALLEWYYGKPGDLGIEIVNFKGVDKLLSTSQNAIELKNLIDNIQEELKERCISKTKRIKMNSLIKKLKKTDIIISNWTSFIGYNLEKWQMIPFFVADNEGNVKHFLESGKPIKFEGKNYDIPEEWKYLWGVTNKNEPFKGNNFELTNFSDKEIWVAVNQVLNEEIDINIIKELRDREEGIKKIGGRILESQKKREIVTVLFENLFKEFEEKKDESLLKRPIFELINKILDLANQNHAPVNRYIELKNKKWLLELLENNAKINDK